MRQNLFYWGPFIDDNIGTKKAIFNSALAINKFSEKYKSTIINSIGEWDNDRKNNLVNFLDFQNKNYKKLPRFGFIKSRISFIIIFIKCFWKLKKVLKKERPEYLIVHLMTSIPFVLFLLFKFKTKILFRVSGKPKLNFLRKILWKLVSKNISLVFCNTAEQRNELIREKIFSKKKNKSFI